MLFIKLNRQADRSLTRQLYEQLPIKIVSGELPPLYKLPASRTLAEELHISRNLVTEVYETLKVEGFIESRSGSGTYVSKGASLKSFQSSEAETFSHRDQEEKTVNENHIYFNTGIPESIFPKGHWARCLRESVLYGDTELFGYGYNNGIPQLQESLKQWLALHKGIHCLSDQILIFPGTHQALELLMDLFSSKSGKMIIEDPQLPSIRDKASSYKKLTESVSIDDKGLVVEEIQKIENINSVLVTPSHHYPLSTIMTVQRRIQLIEYAVERNFWIIENDYDGELIYKGPVVSSIHLLSPEKVIHIGSFSGTMFPSIKLAYMVVPKILKEKITMKKGAMGYVCPSLEQLAMAKFIDHGYYDDHLIRLKKHFSRQYNFIIKILTDLFGNMIQILGIGAGQYITVRFKGLDFSGALWGEIQNAGVFPDFAFNCTDNKSELADILVFCFGKLTNDEIAKGISTLKGVIDKEVKTNE